MNGIINQSQFNALYDGGQRNFWGYTFNNVDFDSRNKELTIINTKLTGYNLRHILNGEIILPPAARLYSYFSGTEMSLDDFVGLKDMGFKNFNNVTIRGKKNEESRELDLFGIRLNRAKIVDVDLSKAVIDGQNRTLNELTFSNVRVGKAQLVEIMRETRNLEGLDLGDAVL